MTVKELKRNKNYSWHCDMTKRKILKEITNTNCFDEWGCVCVSLGDEMGVEYNLYIDNTTNENINSSAIYKVDYNEEEGYIETDYDTFIPYKIDFDNPKWKKELENAMCEALIKFFNL